VAFIGGPGIGRTKNRSGPDIEQKVVESSLNQLGGNTI